MSGFIRQALLIAVIVFSTVACRQTEKKGASSVRFHALLENYWKGLLKLQPLDAIQFGDSSMNDQFVNTCTEAYRTELKSFYSGYLDSLKSYNPDGMTEEDALSYQILKYDAEMQLERAHFDTWKIPFTQFGDPGNTLSGNIVLAMGQLGSGESSQPFKTVKDYDNWLHRVQGYTVWCDSAIQNFRQGIATNYVLPKSLVLKMIDICNGLVSSTDTSSIFYGPVKKMPPGFTTAEKDSIITAYKAAIKELNVTHQKLSAFLKDEYLPKAKTTSGVGDMPDGAAYYRFCVKSWTTTDKTLDEIYNTGLS